MKSFSEKLTAFIRQNGLTKQDFGETIGSGRQAVLNYTNGREPSLAFIQKIVAKYPDFDLNYFLKDHLDKPTIITKLDSEGFVGAKFEQFQLNILNELELLKSQNEEILKKINR